MGSSDGDLGGPKYRNPKYLKWVFHGQEGPKYMCTLWN